MTVTLRSVYSEKDKSVSDGDLRFLFEMLKERDPVVNISHREMPTWENHVAFVMARPYEGWFVILADGSPVGSCYISRKWEIGLFIAKAHQRKGFGSAALDLLTQEHPGHYLLANINPANAPSISLFEGRRFVHIQNTYRLDLPQIEASAS